MEWTRKWRIATTGLLLYCLFACSQEAVDTRQHLLSGRWQALEVMEEGRPLEVDPAEIRFAFYTDGTYDFQSTLNYREAGRYALQSEYLLTTDTLTTDSGTEKAVEITLLNADTLRLRMMEDEKERFLLLTKTEDLSEEIQ